MPYAVHLDPASGIAVIRLSGSISGRDILVASREVFYHPDWQPGFSTLWDATRVQSILLLPEDVAAYSAAADDFSARRGPGRTAIVTTDSDVHISGLLLALKSKREPGREFHVFGRVEAARRWLEAGS